MGAWRCARSRAPFDLIRIWRWLAMGFTGPAGTAGRSSNAGAALDPRGNVAPPSPTTRPASGASSPPWRHARRGQSLVVCGRSAKVRQGARAVDEYTDGPQRAAALRPRPRRSARRAASRRRRGPGCRSSPESGFPSAVATVRWKFSSASSRPCAVLLASVAGVHSTFAHDPVSLRAPRPGGSSQDRSTGTGRRCGRSRRGRRRPAPDSPAAAVQHRRLFLARRAIVLVLAGEGGPVPPRCIRAVQTRNEPSLMVR